MVEGAEYREWLRLIPLLPLAAAAVHGVMLAFLRRKLSRTAVLAFSWTAPILSFLVTCRATYELIQLDPQRRLLIDELFPWIGAGDFHAGMALHFDPLACVLTLVVTGVGSLIHIYAAGYMDDDHRDDGGFQRFFCYLNLFSAAMLFLVLGDNLLVMFLGWEGVGLCSYLLIGFWYGDRYNAYCGSKAFIVNRIGDFGFLCGIFLLFWALADAGHPTVVFREVEAHFGAIAGRTVPVPAWFPGPGEWQLATVIGLALFLGAIGKSAQLPLYTWLPDAMAGPTPVSALIHAATMVTAGVYMVCRMSFLYAEAPGASATIAWVGGLTAVFTATMAIAQTDIKKVLAYSTVSQLGYMFLAAGCGSYVAAMFHVTTHAFFKALLFLGSGAVIMAMHHEQDTDLMGGLRKRLPLTHLVFLIGVLAISGLPPLSGFFSKDEILLSAWVADEIPGHQILYAIGLVTSGITAFYMMRLYARTFLGSSRAPHDVQAHIHEPPPVVTTPLIVLAVLSAVGGFIGLSQAWGDLFGVPNSNSLANFLHHVVYHDEGHHVSHATERLLALLKVSVAAAGLLLGWWLYVKMPELPLRIRTALGGLYRLVRDRYYVDELYDAVFVRPLVFVSDRVLFRGIDAGLIDGIGANGTAQFVRGFANRALKYAHSGLAQGYLFAMVLGTVAVVAWLVTAR